MYEELDYRQTSLGELILRRRRILKLDRDVVEVILNDEHLMSDMFTASEIALARLPLDRMVAGRTADADGEGLHIVVGGLGLGYTADAVLGYEAVSSLTVVEYLAPLIEWHEAGILPLARRLADDPRCRFVEGNFFALARGAGGFDPEAPGRRFDGIFLDIDHSPDFHLNPSHADFYSAGGLSRLQRNLAPGGIFALWSNDPPDAGFLKRMKSAFSEASAEAVVFFNPLLDEDCTQTVYLGMAGSNPITE